VNSTPEHPAVLEEYAKTRGLRDDLRFVIHFPINGNGRSWEHGDVMEIPVIGELPDGSLLNLAFPDKVEIRLNLWGADEQTLSFLRWIVSTWKPEVVFETGTHKGRSTKAIADSLDGNNRGHITTVDLADHGVAGRVQRTTFVQGKLPEALHQEPILRNLRNIDLAYLDGPHTATEVEKEVNFVLERKAERGCYILVDDAGNRSWPEVNEYLRTLPGAFVLPTPHGLGILRG